ncbi:hypothetical protein CEQ21_19240 [Niallia circulans]|uniref:Uncharacterized protein n=1 Tax=Niallia circulans TaxID=1397 RepID=A0A553SKR8_NIACI|nr:hypothetical protein [Niallia circulans]TRZ37583.1 hypothetical protein CEQ21_19240 [Niallia circulans]
MKTEISLQSDFQNVDKEMTRGKLVNTPGLWINGKICWLQNGYEKILPEYSVSVHVKSVQKHSKVQYNEIYVRNHSKENIEVKVLLLSHFSKSDQNHLAFVSPTDNVIFHSVEDQLILVNGEFNGSSLEQRTVQPIWNVHTDLIWKNQDNGSLKYLPMGKGGYVSICSLHMNLAPQTSNMGRTWTIYGNNKEVIMDLNQILLKNSTSIS